MAVMELDSFYFKFKNLLLSEKDATLTLKSEAGRAYVTLTVDLGHAHTVPHQFEHPRNGTSKQRRRERRAAARNTANKTEQSPVAVEASDLPATTKENKPAVEALKVASAKESHKEIESRKCSVIFHPMDKTASISEFRERIENYFEHRKDIIEKVVNCEVESTGNTVKLKSLVKTKMPWLMFFSSKTQNYGDLHGVAKVVHACQDLRNCEPG